MNGRDDDGRDSQLYSTWTNPTAALIKPFTLVIYARV
jgi:hypothetical protein